MPATTDRTILEFSARLHAAVLERSLGGYEPATGVTTPGDFQENVFTQEVIEQLEEAGVLEEGLAVYCSGQLGRAAVKVNGYGVSDDEDRLDVFTTIFTATEAPEAVAAETVRAAFKQATRFVREMFAGRHNDLEPASDAWSMGSRIHELSGRISRVRVFLFTNGIVNLRDAEPDRTYDYDVTWQIWDLERLSRSLSTGRPHEAIEIDVKEECGTGLHCLPVPIIGESDYESYLCVIPGKVLYSLYEEYGSRLLELNVRSFLQARGKVNKGIRETIQRDPIHFFPYNNGLSMTASDVRIEKAPGGGHWITHLKGLQIVNGGQTTASIHRARKVDRADLSSIFVQAKLTVVQGEYLEEMVPKISKYANSQNAVSEADFSANHPFHIAIERLAATTWVPGEASRWFYERARGQYQVAQAREALTPAQKRQFLKRTPPTQKFTKTDLAKYLNAWEELPHIVSRGGQKNFVQLMDRLRIRGSDEPDVQHFKELVAKAILYRAAQSAVAGEGFNAYRANIVAYLVSYLSFRLGRGIDLLGIWQHQDVEEPMRDLMREWSHEIEATIIESAGNRNVTEWCKKEECWAAVRALDLEIPQLLAQRLGTTAPRGEEDVGVRLTREDLENIAMCKRIGSDVWMRVHVWATENRKLTPVHRGVCLTMSSYAAGGWSRDPSHKQARVALQALDRAREFLSDL